MYWTRASLLALSMTALGRALQVSDGELGHPPYPSIAWLTIAIIITSLALFLPRPFPVNRRAFQVIVTLCLLINFAQIAAKPPAYLLGIHSLEQLTPFATGLLIAAVLCGRALAGEGGTRMASFAGVLLIFAFLGNWIIVNSPDPRIDVFIFQKDSSAALLDGQNPYTLTFPQIYQPAERKYGEGVVKGGRLQFGYPYMPETLLEILPAAILHADTRYAQLAAILLSAALIAGADRSAAAFAAALLMLTTPRFFYVLEKSWIEPFNILALAATVATALRWPKLLPLALGLFLASKQYVPAAAILCFCGRQPLRNTMILLARAAAIAFVVTLPLAVWDLRAFLHSALTLQFRQPFRPDSLSYLAWAGEDFWPKIATVIIPFAAFFLGVALVLWRRASIGFASGVAFCFLLFFAFNKQAFANYYFFVIGAMACGIAELTSLEPLTAPD